MSGPPPGFASSERSSPFLDLIGPLYVADDGAVLGLRARPELLNGRGMVHGAVLCAVADVALGRAVAAAARAGAVTVNLTTDFLSPVEDGAWLECRAEVRRTGRRLGFAQAVLTVEGRPVAQASGVFAMSPPRTASR